MEYKTGNSVGEFVPVSMMYRNNFLNRMPVWCSTLTQLERSHSVLFRGIIVILVGSKIENVHHKQYVIVQQAFNVFASKSKVSCMLDFIVNRFEFQTSNYYEIPKFLIIDWDFSQSMIQPLIEEASRAVCISAIVFLGSLWSKFWNSTWTTLRDPWTTLHGASGVNNQNAYSQPALHAR